MKFGNYSYLVALSKQCIQNTILLTQMYAQFSFSLSNKYVKVVYAFFSSQKAIAYAKLNDENTIYSFKK